MIRLTSKIVTVVMAMAMMATAPASAGIGVHTTTGTAIVGTDTVTVAASEPGIGTAVVNGTPYQVVCMVVWPGQAAPGGWHDVFIKAIGPVSADGSATNVYIYIVDFPTGVDQLAFNYVGITPPAGIACDADQVAPQVTLGNYTTAP